MSKGKLVKSKNLKFSKNWGPGAEFPYLGISAPKHENCDNFSLV